jgi:hypothetical protein
MSPGTTSSLPRLPAELTDVVIDFLHDDEDGLANCSLVCKAWLPATRYHIFENLVLDPWSIESFVDLITQPLATVAPVIHQLAIDMNRTRFHTIFNLILTRLPRFHMLRRLELRRVRWYALNDQAIKAINFAFGGIAELSISHNTFWDPKEVVGLVSGFTSLQKLSFRDLDWKAWHDASPNFDQWCEHVPPELHVVDLGDILIEVILKWLLTQKPTPIVDTLSLSCYRACPQNADGYLQALGPQLQHLVLRSEDDIGNMLALPVLAGAGTS